MAQLAARLVRDQEVGRSNRLTPTAREVGLVAGQRFYTPRRRVRFLYLVRSTEGSSNGRARARLARDDSPILSPSTPLWCNWQHG